MHKYSNINMFNTCGMKECTLYTLAMFDLMLIFGMSGASIHVFYFKQNSSGQYDTAYMH